MKYFAVAASLWVSLIIQTENGQVSIVRDFKSMRECRFAACVMRSYNPGSGVCDAEGRMTYPYSLGSGMFNVSPSNVKIAECLD